MARLVVLAIVLLAVAVQVHSQVSRADVNDVRLNDLYERLQSISEVLSNRDTIRATREKQLIELTGRVNDLKDDGCPKRTYRCGGRSKRCIHDMLVCDNSPDCEDGSDEDDCQNPAKAGTTLIGNTYNVKCLLDNTPETIRVDVIGEKRWTDFPSVAVTTILFTQTMYDGSVKKATYKGLYSYGQKTLVVYPNEGDSLAMACTFRTSKSPFCFAKFGSIATKMVCAEAILNVEE